MYSHRSTEIDDAAREAALGDENDESSQFLNLNRFVDHTLLKPDAKPEQFQMLVDEAINFKFRAVCIPPSQVKFVAELLKKQTNDIGVCTVVSFPLGYATTTIKVAETEDALSLGATEIDFVQNVSLVKHQQWGHWEHECSAIVAAAKGRLVKIILETSLLTDNEIRECAKRAALCGVHTIKTSTGFGTRGASIHDIDLIKSALNDVRKQTNRLHGIKASGGIRSRADAIAMIRAGATRLGTSNGVAILSHSSITGQSY